MNTTSKTLLEQIKTGDAIAWNEFYRRYKPFAWAIGRERGLSPDQCEELVQAVMLAIFQGAEKFTYDPAHGKFRNYLYSVTRSRIADIFRTERRGAAVAAAAAECPDAEEADRSFEQSFDREYRLYLLALAEDELRRRISTLAFEVYDLAARRELSPVRVAAMLGVSVNAVYTHKSRALKIMREILSAFDEEAR